MNTRLPSHKERALNAALATALALCVVRLWFAPLGSSFWLDETVTAFVVRNGADHPSLAIAPQVPNSMYYWLPRVATLLFGESEIVYRVPSLLAMGAALFVVARLAARLVHPRAAWFAAFACFALSGINYQASDARPYALGSCLWAAAMLFLVRWLDSGKWSRGLLFALFAALLWRVHLAFWPFYIVAGLYAVIRLSRRETPVTLAQAGAIYGLTAAALAPVFVSAIPILRQADTHVIAQPPTLHVFEHALRWNLPLILAGAAFLLNRVLRWKRGPAPDSPSLALVSAWWLCPPICLFAFSWITGDSVFLPRYLSPMLPGAALTAVALAAPFIPAGAWKRLALALGAGVLLFMGQWARTWPVHEHSDWRGAARYVNARILNAATPVICTSPFIEGRAPAWSSGYRLPGFLYAHLEYYPITGRPLLLPFVETSPEAQREAAAFVRDSLAGSSRFLLYGWNVSYWQKWFSARPEFRLWSAIRSDFGDVNVVEFNPPRQP